MLSLQRYVEKGIRSAHPPNISYLGKIVIIMVCNITDTRPFWRSSIVCFWMQLARYKERKYYIFRQSWYTRNVPVFTNTGTFQYLGREVYFFQSKNTLILMVIRGLIQIPEVLLI